MSTNLEYTDKDGNTIPIDTTNTWVNYGDANPKEHGGNWVRYVDRNDMWKVVETRNGYDYPHIDDNEIEVIVLWIEPQDLFVKGDPDNGPTGILESEIESLSNVDNYENALVDFPIEYFVAGITHRAIFDQRSTVIDKNNYWDYLRETHDITDS